MLTRRELLKLGLLSGGYTVLTSGSGLRRVFADDELPASPRLTPFQVALPFPPEPKDVVGGFTSTDCSDFTGSGTRFFKILEEERSVQVHPALPPTPIWGYRDANTSGAWPFVLGPTFKVRIAQGPGQGVVVRMTNNLPKFPAGFPDPLRGFGVPHMTTHLHGGHHPSGSDGFPDNITSFFDNNKTSRFHRFVSEPGQSYDYCYPLRDPGFSTGQGDKTERPSTLWYHDHFFDFTGPNVYRGLAGFFLVFDEVDSGNETDTSSQALRLPSGPFDIPLVLQDKRVDSFGHLIYDPLDHDGFLGDTFFVNGAVQPFHYVKRRKYRFRFLNGSNARFYKIFLTNSSGQTFPMDQIATEGGLLAAPIRNIQSFQIAPAERVEVVVNFSTFPDGTNLFFENRLAQDDGRKPGDVLSRGTQLLQLRVQGAATDPSQVPDVLRPFAPISASELAGAIHKEFEFERTDGAWAINGRFADLEHALTTSVRKQGEIWHLDSGGGWAHPVHIHLEYMRVLRRDGELPPPNERDGMAKKDTIVIGADFGNVDIFIKFRDYPGPFVFHCHNIEHEDMRMMARMDIV
jgi:FtsP/CotA-like multicopper oxidase with cupredoxin domain